MATFCRQCDREIVDGDTIARDGDGWAHETPPCDSDEATVRNIEPSVLEERIKSAMRADMARQQKEIIDRTIMSMRELETNARRAALPNPLVVLPSDLFDGLRSAFDDAGAAFGVVSAAMSAMRDKITIYGLTAIPVDRATPKNMRGRYGYVHDHNGYHPNIVIFDEVGEFIDPKTPDYEAMVRKMTDPNYRFDLAARSLPPRQTFVAFDPSPNFKNGDQITFTQTYNLTAE